ncbi:MAG TPA: T9SS type A sorting domain-containing protein [Chitinophagaceae bacterium]|nr:T9SS type A sorting domain-containing protein [Chitinophagaceae bacterium]
MKKIFTLCVLTCIVIVSRSQAVLNEIYPQPGNGYDEFFELYNPGTTPGSENLDNYTVVTYYEESGGKSGFYVLDLPNQTLNAQGYYVCASQSPFNIQGQPGLTANSSWNSLPSSGSLTKWEKNGSSYTSVAVPANLNDLFAKITGSGGVFHVFLFKNGVIVNGVIAGINTTVIPAYIKSMPNLFVDMSGSSPDFTINFNTIPDNSIEYISSSAGTNNGYYRSADGKCGVWLKSDSPGQHTPGQTNGSAANAQGQLSVAAVISQYATDPTKSLLTYNITAGPAIAFPVTVEIYSDLGVIGELDLNDILVDSRVINTAAAGAQNIILPTNDDPVIIVIKSASGCHDKIIPLEVFLAALPIHLTSFQGNINKENKATLQWTIANNEIVDQFEVQRSYDGNEFKTIGIVFASEKKDIEDYMFYEKISSFDKVMYRLKLIDKNNAVSYSRILVFQTKLTTTNNTIKIIGNPVTDKLIFSYTALAARSIDVKIYDMGGRIMMNHKVNSLEGNNIFSISLSPALKSGLYLVEVNNGTDIQTAKFVKQ